MSTPNILAFAGSLRKDSFNKRLVKIALRASADAGAETTFVDLSDFQMPLYCQDYEVEHGIPDSVVALKQLMKSHDGFLIASPEYNGSLTGSAGTATARFVPVVQLGQSFVLHRPGYLSGRQEETDKFAWGLWGFGVWQAGGISRTPAAPCRPPPTHCP